MLLRSIFTRGSLTAALLLTACVEAPTLPPPAPPAIPEWPAAGEPAVTLESAIAGDWRSEANRARDVYRHPLQTLEFFGIEPDMNVLEIWPGNGWYSEILAPLLRNHGHYLAAGFADVPSAPEYQRKTNKALRDKFAADPLRYGRAEVTQIGPPNLWQPVVPNSMDAVLTFRNVHNWLASNTEREMFAAFHRSLKVGGVLGIVEHRANPGTPREEMVRSGYVTQELVIELATQAGFRYVAWEEINANPRDTKDYAAGVWALPPTLRNKDVERDRFLAIGESDRMTLKFVKTK